MPDGKIYSYDLSKPYYSELKKIISDKIIKNWLIIFTVYRA